MANRTAILAIRIVSDAKNAAKGFRETETAAQRMEGKTRKAALVGAVGLAALAKGGWDAAQAAADDAKGQAILAKALQNSAGATAKQVAATEDFIDKTARATGVADDQLRPALGALVRATGDVDKAQQAMALALDVSAATGKPVEAVSAALAKGYGGQTTALGRLVRGMDRAILKSGDMEKITAELARTTGGSAAAAADTAAGKWQRFQLRIGELQETIGGYLLPIFDRAVAVLSSVMTWVENNTTSAMILAGVLGTLAAAMVAINVAWRVYIVVQKAVELQQAATNRQMAMNPIGLVIVAVIALVAGLVLLYKRSERVRTIVQAVGKVGQAAFGWVIDRARALGTFLGGQVASKFRTVQAVARAFGTGARTAMGWVIDRARDVWRWFENLRAKVGAVRDVVVAGFERMLSPIQSVLNTVQDVVSWVGRIKFPSVPGPLAKLAGGLGLGGGSSYTPAPVVASGMSVAPAGSTTIVVPGLVDADNLMRLLRRQGVRLGRSSTVVVG